MYRWMYVGMYYGFKMFTSVLHPLNPGTSHYRLTLVVDLNYSY